MAILTEGFNSFGSSFVPSELPNAEDYSCDNHGDIRAIQEAYEDMVGVVEAIASYDFHDLKMRKEAVETGVSVESLYPVYESGFSDKVKEIFDKIKKFILDLWAKIKAFFKTAIASIVALFMKGRDFVKKYRPDLDSHKSESIELQNGFKYTNLDKSANMSPDSKYKDSLKKIADAASKLKYTESGDVDKSTDHGTTQSRREERSEYFEAAEEIRSQLTDIKNNKEDLLDRHRGSLLGQGSVSASQFDDKIYAYFRSGKNEGGQVKWTVAEAISILENDYSKVAKEAEQKMNENFKDALDDLAKFENMTSKAPKGMKDKIVAAAKESSSFLTNIQSLNQMYFRKQKEAIFAAEATAKRVCIKAIGGKTDKE